MRKDTTGEADVIRLRQDLSSLLRRRVLEAVESVLEEELSEALGTGRYERSEERRGYRNGHETRRITTELGPQTLEVPRGRIVEDDGRAREFQSRVVPRYARRTRKVDEAILGAYLAGANTRRIRKALEGISKTVRPGPAGRGELEDCDDSMKLRFVVQRVRNPPGQG